MRCMGAHLGAAGIGQDAVLEAIHRLLPARVDRREFRIDRARPIILDLGDHEKPVRDPPDLHVAVPALADPGDHLGPDRSGTVRGLISRDQLGIVDQVEREADATCHHAMLQPPSIVWSTPVV